MSPPAKVHCGKCDQDCTEHDQVQVYQFGKALLILCLDCEERYGERLRIASAMANAPMEVEK